MYQTIKYKKLLQNVQNIEKDGKYAKIGRNGNFFLDADLIG